MAYSNGRLPDSVLAPIPGGRLIREAAAAWNAMNVEAHHWGVLLYPMGSMSSYRTYSQQVYLWNNVAHAHDTNWVAYPGTSNHGWGLAVDLQTHYMRMVLDRIGARYGWQKQWSDAPVEWWHIRYRYGVWHGHVQPTDKLKGLSGLERHHAVSLLYRRRRYLAEARTGHGPRYRYWRALASREHGWIRRHMNALARDAKRSGWNRNNRGGRYQTLARVLRAANGRL